MTRHQKSHLVVGASVLAALLLSVPTQAAQVSVVDEQHEGAQILRSVKDGSRDCADLSKTDFELVGEYSMGRTFGSPQAHESMNERITAMMGTRGEEGMHVILGVRSTGCSGTSLPGNLSGAMGVAGAMGMMGGGNGSAMGGGPLMGGSAMGGAGSPMGGSAAGDSVDSVGGSMGNSQTNGMDSSNDWGVGGVLLAILAAGLIIFVGVFYWRRPPGRQGSEENASDILARRLASGEIDADEYESRRRALQGPAT